MQIPQERLNEIAQRRLVRLGIAAQVPMRGGEVGALEGTLNFANLVHPVTHERLSEVPFRIVGHDRFELLEPRLTVLEPIPFHDLTSQAQLEERIRTALAARAAIARAKVGELERLKLTARIDPVRLVAQAEVQASHHVFTLEADVQHVRVVRMGTGNTQRSVGGSATLLQLAQFTSLVDLEIELSVRAASFDVLATNTTPASATPANAATGEAPAAVALPGAAAGAAPPPLAPIRAAVPNVGAALAPLLARFGVQAHVTACELVEDFTDGVETFRLTASYVQGASFRVALWRSSAPERPLFSDTVDVTRMSSTLELTSSVLGRTVAKVEPQDQAPATDAQGILPRPGEIWIMSVLVERDDPTDRKSVV